jgi:hypothetical protein
MRDATRILRIGPTARSCLQRDKRRAIHDQAESLPARRRRSLTVARLLEHPAQNAEYFRIQVIVEFGWRLHGSASSAHEALALLPGELPTTAGDHLLSSAGGQPTVVFPPV